MNPCIGRHVLHFVLSLGLGLGISLNAGAADSADAAAIRMVMTEQAAAWNRGDLEAFMKGYWQDEALRFASGGSVTHGWQATLDRYRQRYADRAAMGTLRFTELEIEPLSADAALVFGHWSLTREADQPQGLFTLLFRKTAAGWVITRDHSSAAGP